MFVAIVPAHNEALHIGSVVRDLFQHVDSVVVVDDGSVDNTAMIAHEAGAVVIRHTINRGQGAALQTGHAYALARGAAYVLHFDGDGQFDVVDILPALRALQTAKADILFGSRFLGVVSDIPWLKRYVILPLARVTNHWVGGVPLSDAHNGFRILTRQALERIMITQDRMAHASEIPLLAKHHGLRYMEFPVTVVYREYGQGLREGLTILKDLLFGRFVRPL